MKKLFGLAVVSAVALTGCSSKPPCTAYADSLTALIENYRVVCSPDSKATRPADATMTQCDTDAEAICTDVDRDALEKYADCVNDLPQCTTANKESFEKQAQGCFIHLVGISEDCLSVIGRTLNIGR